MEKTIEVSDPTQVAEVRRVVAELGRAHGMLEADLGRAALVTTEAATNLVKYGKRGVVAVSWFEEGGASGIQLVAADHGPGFANFQQAARDGHSTGGSLGIGLGAILRTADLFDVYSIESRGAALLIRISSRGVKGVVKPGALWVGSRSLPKAGQEFCGDTWAHKKAGRWERVCVIDGLGHGPLAATASSAAAQVFRACPESDSPMDILQKAHTALASTRGAVMAVVAIDAVAGIAAFAGIGNIAGVIFGAEKPQHLLSAEGIVGYNVRAIRQNTYPWTADSTVVLNSDGLSTRWNLANAPGLLRRHPALIAAALHRDFARDTDDSTVLVARTHP